jgi:hypothetical protein
MIVELNARWHLTNFKPLCDECVGANALDATLDAFLDPEAFDALPTIPEKVSLADVVVPGIFIA